MTDSPTAFPLLSTGYERPQQTEPIMLDGMEVLFQRSVGLYPVMLEPKKHAAGEDGPLPARAEALGRRAARRHGHPNRRR
jgi:hypothetical protein